MDGPFLLRRWRTETRKLSQHDAATLIGAHQNTWSDWENGEKTPRTEMAFKLDLLTGGDCPADSWATEDTRVRWRAAHNANSHTANDFAPASPARTGTHD